MCKRFLCLFLPAYKYKSITVISLISDKYLFITKGTEIIDLGYKELYKNTDKAEETEEDQKLPKLNIHDNICVKSCETKEETTKSKSRYNVGNITDLMEKYSIGRPSTMGEIVNKCINTGVIELVSKGKKKEYKATDFGKNIIKIVPEELKSTNLCHRVEEKIINVRKGKISLKE